MGDWFVWMARLMFVGILLLGGGMLFRAWAIGVRKDLRHVADWRGRRIQDGARWANAVNVINLVGGLALWTIAALVLMVGLPFTTWTGTGALVLWTYYFALRLIVQRAERAAQPAPSDKKHIRTK